jgi:hypothetical protein
MPRKSFKVLSDEIRELRKALSTSALSGVRRRELEALIERAILDLHELLKAIIKSNRPNQTSGVGVQPN